MDEIDSPHLLSVTCSKGCNQSSSLVDSFMSKLSHNDIVACKLSSLSCVLVVSNTVIWFLLFVYSIIVISTILRALYYYIVYIIILHVYVSYFVTDARTGNRATVSTTTIQPA